VQDQDGVLGMNDLQEGDTLRGLQAADHPVAGPANLVGRPLSEVERYYVQQTLELTQGNREEAARMLGIGERTLYRMIQDWKLQDRIKQALADSGGRVAEAARLLGLKQPALERKIKKWGMRTAREDGAA